MVQFSGPQFFPIYINDLAEGISSTTKLFADDTSLFSVVNNINKSDTSLLLITLMNLGEYGSRKDITLGLLSVDFWVQSWVSWVEPGLLRTPSS